MITPVPGHVVWYFPGGEKSVLNGDQPFAATVAYVHGDRKVNLGYLDWGGVHHVAADVRLLQDDDEVPDGPFCRWMPTRFVRVKDDK